MLENHPAYLSPSELGTKDYWESFYARTLAHLSSKSKPGATPTPVDTNTADRPSTDQNEVDSDDDDPGTSWFTEHNAPDKILSFLTSSHFPLAPCNTLPAAAAGPQDIPKLTTDQPAILDLGTGNGSMLALLRGKGGFRGDMVGVDYSERSVVLSRALHSDSSFDRDPNPGKKGTVDDEDDASGLDHYPNTTEGIPVSRDHDQGIRFEVWDILASDGDFSGQDPGKRLDWFPYDTGGFDIVLDKGTFDAVSLSDEHVPGSGERVCERYPGIARTLVRRGGFLVVTSCNWTEDELAQWFTGDHDDELKVWGRVEYPRFRFGGHEGQGVCTVCFQRN